MVSTSGSSGMQPCFFPGVFVLLEPLADNHRRFQWRFFRLSQPLFTIRIPFFFNRNFKFLRNFKKVQSFCTRKAPMETHRKVIDHEISNQEREPNDESADNKVFHYFSNHSRSVPNSLFPLPVVKIEIENTSNIMSL